MPESGPTGTIPTGAPKPEGQMPGPSSVEEMPVAQAADQQGSERRVDAGLAIDPVPNGRAMAAAETAPRVSNAMPDTPAQSGILSPEELSHRPTQEENAIAHAGVIPTAAMPGAPEDNLDVLADPSTPASTNFTHPPQAIEDTPTVKAPEKPKRFFKSIGDGLKKISNLFRKQPGEDQVVQTGYRPDAQAAPLQSVSDAHKAGVESMAAEAIKDNKAPVVWPSQRNTIGEQAPSAPQDPQDKIAA